MLYENFHNGLNLGGWLSQYEFVDNKPLTDEYLMQHFNSFITEKDLCQIASWGFDHVRVPVSGYLLYDPDHDTLDTQTVHLLRLCIAWCEKHHLNMILDLHDLWGNEYGAMQKAMPLLTDPALKQRFVRIWELLTIEFKDVQHPILMFELLNEVSDASGAYPSDDITGNNYDFSNKSRFLWNQLVSETIQKIRSIDSSRWILVGSNGQNSVVYLKELQIFDDPLVFYNFHYYDPQVFTHQRAHFSDELREFGQTVTYPGDISSFIDFLKLHPEYYTKHALVAKESTNDLALMKRLLQYATDFIQKTGKELYCGEFGVIDTAPVADAAKWLKDFTTLLEKYRIGHAQWNYKCLDFGLLDHSGNPVSELYREVIKKA